MPAALTRLVRRPAVWVLVIVVAYTVYEARDDPSKLVQFGILGIAVGSVYAIAAAGLVLTYTTTGVFNFAHGAVGMIAAYLYFTLRVDVGLPAVVAVVIVVFGFAPVVGLGLERVMRSFKNASPGTTLTVTIALTVLLIGVAQYAYPNTGAARLLPSLFGDDRRVDILGATLLYDQIAFVIVAAGIAAGLRFLLFVSRTGVAMRAVVDNPDLAALNGTRPTTIARYAWILGAVLAATAGVLFAPQQNPLEPIVLTFFVLNAYGAAVVGRLQSLPLTFAGAIGLGVLQNWFTGIILARQDRLIGDNFLTEIPWNSAAVALPGIFLLAALLTLPEVKLTVGRVVGRTEPRVPAFATTVARSAAFVAIMGVVARLMPADYVPDTARALVYGVLLLSLVVLTGYSGQISLAQYVFLGVGAWAMGSSFGGDSILGIVAATVVAVPLGAIVALPALRLQGLYLALATFAFAIASRELIFQNESVYGGSNRTVGRLDLLGLDFAGNRVFIVLCAVVFAAVAVGVLGIRRSPLGRRLSALRDSPAACATLGLDIRNTKLLVFCISSGIAGLAGALFGGINATVGTLDFEPINNVVLFLFAFVGGITTVSGALIGGALFALLPLVQSEAPEAAGLVFAAVAVAALLLGRQPNGIAGQLFERWSPRPRQRRDPAMAAGAPVATPEASHA